MQTSGCFQDMKAPSHPDFPFFILSQMCSFCLPTYPNARTSKTQRSSRTQHDLGGATKKGSLMGLIHYHPIWSRPYSTHSDGSLLYVQPVCSRTMAGEQILSFWKQALHAVAPAMHKSGLSSLFSEGRCEHRNPSVL